MENIKRFVGLASLLCMAVPAIGSTLSVNFGAQGAPGPAYYLGTTLPPGGRAFGNEGNASAPLTPGFTFLTPTTTLGPLGKVSTSAAFGVSDLQDFGLGLSYVGSISVDARATAWWGTLHTFAAVRAVASAVGFVGGVGGPPHVPYYAAGAITLGARSDEFLQVFDPTRPLGDLVFFDLTRILDATLIGTPNGQNARSQVSLFVQFRGTGVMSVSGDTSDFFLPRRATATFGVKNGDFFELVAELQSFAVARAGPEGFNATDETALADASNTGHIFLDSSNPNLQFLASSGHNYSASALSDEPVSAVPIPAALPLLATGCIGLFAYGWNRRRRAT